MRPWLDKDCGMSKKFSHPVGDVYKLLRKCFFSFNFFSFKMGSEQYFDGGVRKKIRWMIISKGFKLKPDVTETDLTKSIET